MSVDDRVIGCDADLTDVKPPPDAAPPAIGMFGGAAALAMAGIVGRVASLVSSPYLTNRIGPAGYGVAALVGTWSSLAATIGLMGLDVSYTRFVGGQSAVDASAEARFCWRAAVGLGVMAGLAGAIAFGSLAAVPHPVGLGAMVGAGALLFVLGAMASARRRLLGDYRSLAMALVLGSVTGTLTNVIVVAWIRHDGWALVIGALVGASVALLANGLPVSALGRPSGLPAERRWEVLSLGAGCTVSAPAHWIMAASDRWILAAWWNDSVVGVYNFAAQFGLLVHFVCSAVSAVWLSEIMRVVESHGTESPTAIGRLWEGAALVYMMAWVAVSLAGGDLLRLLSAPAFHEGAAFVPLLAAGTTLGGFVQLGMQSHAMARRVGRAAGPVALAAAASLGLNLVLVPRLGAAGAAWTQVIAFCVLAFVVVWRGQQVFPIQIRWTRVAGVGLLSLLVVGLSHGPFAEDPLLSLVLKILPWCFCALGAAAIMGRETLSPVLAATCLWRRSR